MILQLKPFIDVGKEGLYTAAISWLEAWVSKEITLHIGMILFDHLWTSALSDMKLGS